MATVTFTSTSDATIVPPVTFTMTSDATVVPPVTFTEFSDAFVVGGPTISLTSDMLVIPNPVESLTSNMYVIPPFTIIEASDMLIAYPHVEITTDMFIVFPGGIALTSNMFMITQESGENPVPGIPHGDFPCPVKINCPGSDFPVTNLSSEAPDAFGFIGRNFGLVPFDPTQFFTDAPYLGGTPLNPLFTAAGCIGQCISTVSQEDADDCAARQQTQCVGDDHVDPQSPPPGTPIQIFANSQQSCAFTCPDGTHFTFTVPAGTFTAVSQVLADRMAHSHACAQAAARHVCLGRIQANACLNDPYSSNIPAQGATLAVFPNSNFWELTEGNLPPGLTFNGGFVVGSETATITGTPTTAGSYTFTVKVTTPSGDFMQKVYTICVIAISPTTLPNPVISTPYSETLTLNGCAPTPFTWELTSGALPDGLSLNANTGEISGTPTAGGTFQFTIAASGALGLCSQDYTVNIGFPNVTPDVHSSTRSNFGTNIAAGTYRVAYVNGAMKYNIGQGFELNSAFASPNGYRVQYMLGGFQVMTAFPNLIDGRGDYATQPLCEAGNAGLFLDIVHSGGAPIAVYLEDTPFYGDNIDGSPSPTFSLTKL